MSQCILHKFLILPILKRDMVHGQGGVTCAFFRGSIYHLCEMPFFLSGSGLRELGRWAAGLCHLAPPGVGTDRTLIVHGALVRRIPLRSWQIVELSGFPAPASD